MNQFEVLGFAGEGAFGVVLKCKHKKTGQMVAIKKFKDDEDETTLREVKLLRVLKHENIVRLTDAFRQKGKLHLVFEYMERNVLQCIEANPRGLPFETVRTTVYQLTKAIQYCHTNDVIHRDIKPENLLVNGDGVLKLCDFGVARQVGPVGQKYTDYVATRWYRAPELLVGMVKYHKPIDVWAIGCIMAEITDGQPLFPGESEIDQLGIVQEVVGPLTAGQLSFLRHNPRYAHVRFRASKRKGTLRHDFQNKLPPVAVDFMEWLLTMDPAKRPSPAEVLRHKFFEGMKDPSAGIVVPDSLLEPPQGKKKAEAKAPAPAPAPAPADSGTPVAEVPDESKGGEGKTEGAAAAAAVEEEEAASEVEEEEVEGKSAEAARKQQQPRGGLEAQEAKEVELDEQEEARRRAVEEVEKEAARTATVEQEEKGAEAKEEPKKPQRVGFAAPQPDGPSPGQGRKPKRVSTPLPPPRPPSEDEDEEDNGYADDFEGEESPYPRKGGAGEVAQPSSFSSSVADSEATPSRVSFNLASKSPPKNAPKSPQHASPQQGKARDGGQAQGALPHRFSVSPTAHLAASSALSSAALRSSSPPPLQQQQQQQQHQQHQQQSARRGGPIPFASPSVPSARRGKAAPSANAAAQGGASNVAGLTGVGRSPMERRRRYRHPAPASGSPLAQAQQGLYRHPPMPQAQAQAPPQRQPVQASHQLGVPSHYRQQQHQQQQARRRRRAQQGPLRKHYHHHTDPPLASHRRKAVERLYAGMSVTAESPTGKPPPRHASRQLSPLPAVEVIGARARAARYAQQLRKRRQGGEARAPQAGQALHPVGGDAQGARRQRRGADKQAAGSRVANTPYGESVNRKMRGGGKPGKALPANGLFPSAFPQSGVPRHPYGAGAGAGGAARRRGGVGTGALPTILGRL